MTLKKELFKASINDAKPLMQEAKELKKIFSAILEKSK